MLLVSAKVGPFKSIDQPQAVVIDPLVTAFVGMNEAGKTVFLQALEKSRDAVARAKFDPIEDYPRKDLAAYLKRHAAKPDRVTELVYRLSEEEIRELNKKFSTTLQSTSQFTLIQDYANKSTIHLGIDERPVVEALVTQRPISSDAKAALSNVKLLRAVPEALKDVNLTEEDKAFLTSVQERIAKTQWPSIVEWEVWQTLAAMVPKFLYFGDYDLLPSKMNLADLAQRVEQSASDPARVDKQHLAVLALLRMADISIADFTNSGGYEPLKARIEAVSIRLTDQIMEFWRQNEDLEVEIDITPDQHDQPPFNNGPNLYLRIKNKRHRGVSTPFLQRSRGFIWFFSFLVWFDDVREQLKREGEARQRDLILLLDEPGLSLHALAQADFLRYIDELAERHQVLYTTHSPFMLRLDNPQRIRVVEDRLKIGTVISENTAGSDPRTLFPLQAALGWTIAQNLFISERNLLVEGPSDLIYLKAVSSVLESQGRASLREDITIVPTGGLDKVVTFVALLGANGLQLAVLHDYRGGPEQKLIDLVREKMISPKAVLNASQFRDLAKIGMDGNPTDVEDLFSASIYLALFNHAYEKQLSGKEIKEADLPSGDRVIERIERHLTASDMQLRPSGGFNHYTVASQFASKPPKKLDDDTLGRFEALFATVNGLFK